VLGKWIAFEGLIYDNFKREVHIVHRDPSEFKYFVIGVDEGYEDPAVLQLWGIDNDRRMHLFQMFYQTKVLQHNLVSVAKSFGVSRFPNLERIFAPDPSAAGLKAALEYNGMHVEKIDNDVFDGIQEVRNRLDVAGDGKPRLTIEPKCANIESFLTEVESYHRGKDEKPAKGLDHAMDAMRYAAMYMRDEASGHVYVLDAPEEERPNPNERHVDYPLSNHEEEKDVSTTHIMESERAWES
jgi:hypothetical protein